MNNKNKSYKTVDLYLASFLKASGVRFIDINGPDKKAIFIFEDTPEVHELAKEFHKNGKVGVTDYNHALRDFKSMIFNRD